MRRFIVGLRQLLAELRRRKVYQVAALYCVAAFALLQLADIVLPALGAGDRAMIILLVLIVAGFPVAMLLGWMYDWTEAGVRRTRGSGGSGAEPPSRAVRWLAGLAAVAATVLVSVGGWAILAPGEAEEDSGVAVEGLPPLDPRRIAVLYFDDHSADSSLGYLAAGLTESLLHELGTVPGLAVSSRYAVKPFRDGPVPHDSIVSVLGAGTLVEGSVTRSDDRIRATVQLIEGRTGSHLDSRVIEGSLDQVFAFQDSLARTVSRSLRRHLGREVRLRGAREGATSEEAWMSYRRALELVATLEEIRQAEDRQAHLALLRADSLLADAQRLDPDWRTPAVHRIAIANHLASLLGPRPGTLDSAWARESIARAERVLAVSPESADAHELRGWVHLRLATGSPGSEAATEHFEVAEEDLREAIRIEPESPKAWWALSEVLIHRGRAAEAVHAAQRALDSDVFLDVEESALHSLFYATLQLGPRDEAIRWCDEGRRRFPGAINFVRCRLLILGTFPQVEPDVDRAHALMDTLMALTSPRTAETWRMFGGSHVAQTLARAGMADSARAVLRSVRGDSTPPLLASHEAKVHLLLGDEAEAVRLLRLYLTYDPDPEYLAQDWWFEELRDYPPFRELVGIPSDRP